MFAQIRGALVGLIAGAAALAAIASAQATPMLRLTDVITGASIVITDEGANDSGVGLGHIVYNGGIPVSGGGVSSVWSINVTTGLTKPILGSASHPELDLNSINLTNQGGGGTLRIEFTETDFDVANMATYAVLAGGTTDGTVAYSAYYDSGNTAFAATTLLGSVNTSGGGAFSGSTISGVVPPLSPFSLTQVVTITHNGAWNNSSFNAEIMIPEPAALAALGIGLVAFGMMRRRRKIAA